MGNMIFLFFAVLFICQKGFTAASTLNTEAYVSISDRTPALLNGKKIECKIKFEDLNYVGVSFEGEAICVKADNDNEANVACGVSAHSGYSTRNPANPQYQDILTGTDFFSNPDHYYYCVKFNSRNNKKNICEDRAKQDSSFVKEDPTLVFKWNPFENSTYDGYCLCGHEGDVAGLLKCDRKPPETPDYCGNIGLGKATAEEISAIVSPQEKSDAEKARASCKCSNEAGAKIFPEDTAKAKCANPDSKASLPPDTVDPSLKKCVDNWKNSADKCKTVSEEAQKTCDPKSKESTDEKDLQDSINIVNNMYTNSKSGSGAQQECFKGSLLASALGNSLKLKSDSCASKISSCGKCIADLAKQKDTCSKILDKISADYKDRTDDTVSVNMGYYNLGSIHVGEVTTQGSNYCEMQAKKDETTLSSLLDSVGTSLASSVKCMCKLSSGATTADCNKLASPQACGQNPSLLGCGVYSSISVCTPGVNYNAAFCSCQMNPKGVGCPAGPSSGGLSNFAGGSVVDTASTDTNFGTPSSNLTAGPADLSGLPSGPNAAGNLKLDGPNIGTNGAKGGGPSGNAPRGGDSGGKVTEGYAQNEKSGLGGLFNQAKNFMTNALGLKKTPGADAKAAKKGEAFDPNKFRPTLRGVAGKTGFGTKNMDIWKMLNKCVYAETCQSNTNNFLEAPLKQQ